MPAPCRTCAGTPGGICREKANEAPKAALLMDAKLDAADARLYTSVSR